MGASIAAQLANVGIETILLDIILPELTDTDKKKGLKKESREFRNKLAQNGLQTVLKSRPASFYIPENAKKITIGNLEDDLGRLKKVDWIIEAVIERLDIKQALMAKIEEVRRPGAIITTNTSGIPIHDIEEGRREMSADTFYELNKVIR